MEPPHTTHDRTLHADEKYVVRDPVQIRALMRALIDQRATLTAQVDGRGPSFPSAVLEVEEGTLLLDGSARPAVNRRVAGAGFLLCCAQVDGVAMQFRGQQPRELEQGGYVAFRTTLPEELFYLQRRSLYRLEVSGDDSPWCRIPDPAGGEPLRLRAVDISAGGMAVLLPADQRLLEPGQRYPGCVVELPGDADMTVDLAVRSLISQSRADGLPQLRVGLRFENLPGGAETAIQRHIFRVDRERRARLKGSA